MIDTLDADEAIDVLFISVVTPQPAHGTPKSIRRCLKNNLFIVEE